MTLQPFDIQSLHAAYASGATPGTVIGEVLDRIKSCGDPGIFLHVESREGLLEQARALGPFDPKTKPLWGIPFAIKDNIDASGRTTTAGCPAYAYEAKEDAFCVRLLKDAGAILVGKTNLDQFATGLVGLRTPYPAPRNAFDPSLIPGGSSSGSAVAVARGIVSFALGTDTAGSGRVPAGLNNIVGLKPTLGAISASGIVPACRSLDTVSVFALSVDDAYAVFAAANCYDKTDAYARRVETKRLQRLPPHFRVGVPGEDTRTFFGDRLQSDCFAQALRRIESLGGEIVEIDFTPFYRIAELLYEGAWVAERYTVVEDLLKHHPEALHPVTRKVIARAGGYSGVDVFRDIYRLKELERDAMPLVESVDMLCVPTAPTFYTVAEVEADPLGTNARLGTYTNFVNLMDMCGIAVPVAPRPDGRPGSVTLLAPAGADARVATLARNLHRLAGVPLGTTGWTLPEENAASPLPADDEIELAVVGAHMSGLPLNGALTRLGARFLRASKTAPCYRLYSLPDGPPFRPGLVRDKAGASIDLETWAIPKSRLGEFVSGIPQPLGIGTLTLYTNEQVKGFICESAGLEGATELTNFGGWRQYLSSVDQRKTGGFYGS